VAFKAFLYFFLLLSYGCSAFSCCPTALLAFTAFSPALLPGEAWYAGATSQDFLGLKGATLDNHLLDAEHLETTLANRLLMHLPLAIIIHAQTLEAKNVLLIIAGITPSLNLLGQYHLFLFLLNHLSLLLPLHLSVPP